jgi:hypothetical protein
MPHILQFQVKVSIPSLFPLLLLSLPSLCLRLIHVMLKFRNIYEPHNSQSGITYGSVNYITYKIGWISVLLHISEK